MTSESYQSIYEKARWQSHQRRAPLRFKASVKKAIPFARSSGFEKPYVILRLDKHQSSLRIRMDPYEKDLVQQRRAQLVRQAAASISRGRGEGYNANPVSIRPLSASHNVEGAGGPYTNNAIPGDSRALNMYQQSPVSAIESERETRNVSGSSLIDYQNRLRLSQPYADNQFSILQDRQSTSSDSGNFPPTPTTQMLPIAPEPTGLRSYRGSSSNAQALTSNSSGTKRAIPHIYHDYSQVPAQTSVIRKKTGGVTQPFPEKLYEMLECQEVDPNVVSWLEHGRAFIVRDPKRFTKEIMPK
jgi:hypothetical protein